MFDDEEDFDPEEFKRERARVANLPINSKAKEIFELVDSILATIEEKKEDKVNEVLNSKKGMLFEDAMLLQVKIAGAEAAGLYEIKMANAAIVRQSAINLITHTSGMALFGYKFQEYTDVLREELEEFRILFLDWIAGFDPTDYTVDRWGMFNPPGVNPEDDVSL